MRRHPASDPDDVPRPPDLSLVYPAMIGIAQHWSETMNALIAVIFVLLGTGMGRDVGVFLWAVLASVEWLANRYAGWLVKQVLLARQAMAPSLPA